MNRTFASLTVAAVLCATASIAVGQRALENFPMRPPALSRARPRQGTRRPL